MLRHMFITSPQAAQVLKVSLRTVHRLVADGRLAPAQQLPGPNGAFLFRPSDVEKLATKLHKKRGAA